MTSDSTLSPSAVPQPIAVLIVEDSEHDAKLLARELKTGGFDTTWERVQTENAMRTALSEAKWDLIISDYSIPGFGGLEALAIYHELGLDIPFIAVSGTVGEDVAVECMRRGAHDYFMKDRLTRLCEAVRRELRETLVRREQRTAETALAENEEYLRCIWDNVETGIVLVDYETRQILDVNDTAAAMVGLPKEGILGKRCHEFVCPAERDRCPVLDLGQSVDRSERELVRTDGTRVPIIKSVTPFTLKGRNVLLESFVDITEQKEAEKRKELHAHLLALLNRPNEWEQLTRDLLTEIKTFTGFDAIGIRLREGEDFPYFENDGFPAEFVEKERYLCARDENGAIVRNADGIPCLECMCGNVIQGRTDSSLPFFSVNGSFWTNSTTQLLEQTSEEDLQTRTRNRCHGEGYESVALVPLKAGEAIVGLLQLNDRQPDRFTPEMISFFESIGDSVGIAFTRVQAEKTVIEREAFLDTLLNAIPTPVFYKDRDGRYAGCNVAFEAFFGAPRESLVGKTVFGICPAEMAEVYHGRDSEVLSSGVVQQYESQVLNTRGELRDVVFSKAVFRDDSGEIAGLIGVILDITERKRAEEERLQMQSQLRQSQKLESIGTLAGGVAHEINNPINGIMNYAQLILDRSGQDGPVAEYAGEIVGETERVATIVRDLLSFAGQERQAHAKSRMCDIVDGTLSVVCSVLRHDQITLDSDVPEDLPEIKCRSQQIRQVLMNLITNARDALNEKWSGYNEDKRIILKVECGLRDANGTWTPAPCTSTSPVHDPQSKIRITVEDHGPGIPVDVRERMFEPFYTTKPQDRGTGLGLSVSYGIVKDHGGELSVESEPGKWTRFHVDLPVDNGWELPDGGKSG